MQASCVRAVCIGFASYFRIKMTCILTFPLVWQLHIPLWTCTTLSILVFFCHFETFVFAFSKSINICGGEQPYYKCTFLKHECMWAQKYILGSQDQTTNIRRKIMFMYDFYPQNFRGCFDLTLAVNLVVSFTRNIHQFSFILSELILNLVCIYSKLDFLKILSFSYS